MPVEGAQLRRNGDAYVHATQAFGGDANTGRGRLLLALVNIAVPRGCRFLLYRLLRTRLASQLPVRLVHTSLGKKLALQIVYSGPEPAALLALRVVYGLRR